jgi:hypothetical protein
MRGTASWRRGKQKKKDFELLFFCAFVFFEGSQSNFSAGLRFK